MVALSRSKWIATTFVACAALVACSASPGESTDTESEALTMPPSLCGKAALTSIDDIPAYPNDCGDVNVWSNDGRTTQTKAGTGAGWVQTEGGYGYQCVELAVRYTHFRFGTSTHWGIAEAKDMCATHPSDLKATSSPVHGDLMVFAANDCVGSAGHVAVVSSASSKTISVVQENEGSTGKGSYAKSCAACFLHAARNNVCGDAKNGAYCGATTDFTGGTEGTLYVCDAYAVKSSTACEYGCSAGACAAAPIDAGDVSHDQAPPPDEVTPSDAPSSAPSDASGSGGCTVAPPSRGLDARIIALFGIVVFASARRRRSRLASPPIGRR